MNAKRLCSRCGGTGTYSKGTVVNGVCFGCAGDGQYRPSGYQHPMKRYRVIQYALVGTQGEHLALNVDPLALVPFQKKLGGEIVVVPQAATKAN